MGEEVFRGENNRGDLTDILQIRRKMKKKGEL
jgi:hypothetical protein